ncbi:MAG: hypothetical protein V2A77_07930 [Pseudomonadota bacterium]
MAEQPTDERARDTMAERDLDRLSERFLGRRNAPVEVPARPDLDCLRAASRAQSLDPLRGDGILDAVVSAIMEATQAEVARLHWTDAQGVLRLRAGRTCRDHAALLASVLGLEAAILDKALPRGGPVLVRESREVVGPAEYAGRNEVHCLVVPLEPRSGVMGMILLFRTAAFGGRMLEAVREGAPGMALVIDYCGLLSAAH